MTVSVRFLRSLGVVCVAGLLLGSVVRPSLAFDPSARFAMAGQLGATNLAMGDVNDEISSAREYMRSENWKLLDDLGVGFNYVFDVRAELFGPWMLSLGLGRFTGSTSVDFDQIIHVKPSTTFYQARIFYRVPWRPSESVRFAVGGGIIQSSSAELEARHEQRSVEAGTQRVETLTIGASGTGAVGTLEAEIILNETFTIVGDVGYRYFDLSQDSFDIEISQVDRPAIDGPDDDEIPEGRDLSDASILRHSFILDEQREDQIDVGEFRGKDTGLDFSGVTVNVGLRIYIF